MRLPTEAEWERAARGGLDGQRYPWGDTLEPACAHFCQGGSERRERHRARRQLSRQLDSKCTTWRATSGSGSPIGTRPKYYERAQYLNPQGPENGMMRIVRGGAWVNADEPSTCDVPTGTRFRQTATPTASGSGSRIR